MAMGGRGAYVLSMLLVVVIANAAEARIAADGGAVFFEDEFTGLSLDRWNTGVIDRGNRFCSDAVDGASKGPGVWQDVSTVPCHGKTQSRPYGTYYLANAITMSGGVRRTFPYLVSGPPSREPIPADGDFVYEVKIKFNSLQAHGSAIVAVNATDASPSGTNAPIPGGDHFLTVSGGNNDPKVRVEGVGLFTSVSALNDWNTYQLRCIEDRYQVMINGKAAQEPTECSHRPTTIWIGNPLMQWWAPDDEGGQWTEFSVDYVRVTVPQMYLSSLETRPNIPNESVDDHMIRIEFENLEPDEVVRIEAFGTENTGGHEDVKHTGDRPAGGFAKTANAKTFANPLEVTADADGEATIYYQSSAIGGEVLLTAISLIDDHEVGEADITVKVDGLTRLPAGDTITKNGGREYHHGPSCREGTFCNTPDNNHWGTPDLVATIKSIAKLLPANTGDPIVNDMSLPWGGRFDIDGKWMKPVNKKGVPYRHTSLFGHAQGRAADLNFDTKSSIDKDRVQKAIEDHELELIPLKGATEIRHYKFFDEGNHFHIMD